MHSSHYEIDGEIINVHFNLDMSGDVIVSQQAKPDNDGYRDAKEFRIPGAVILSLVAEFIRSNRIGVLEDASPSEVLGVDASWPDYEVH